MSLSHFLYLFLSLSSAMLITAMLCCLSPRLGGSIFFCFLQDTQLSCRQFKFLFCCFTLVSGTTAVFCFSSTGVFSVGSSWRLPSSFLRVSLNLPALVSSVLFDGLCVFFPCVTSLPMGFLILAVTCCTSCSACSRISNFC